MEGLEHLTDVEVFERPPVPLTNTISHNISSTYHYATQVSGWLPTNVALEMTQSGKGSINLKVLVMLIRSGSTTQVILRMLK